MKHYILHHPLIIFFIGISAFLCTEVHASHIVGGELNYKYLGNNQYEIRLTVYRDCFNGVPPFDEPASIGIFNSANNLVDYPYLYTGRFFDQSYGMWFTYNKASANNNKTGLLMHVRDSSAVPNLLNLPCLTAPNNICYKAAHYIDTVTLPPISGGYKLVYQRCCRNQSILNIVTPDYTGATYYTSIPDTTVAFSNSNPVFKQLPSTFICVNNPFVFDHTATDKDGDSLVYQLCIPYDGSNRTITDMPQPPFKPSPSYSTVTWKAPYSLSNPLGGVPLKIDSKTGILTATPNTLGQFVYAVCVDEYRNGKLISTTSREFQVNVMNCPSTVTAAIQAPSLQCGSNTVSFLNNSIGASSYYWDFGVKTLTNDTSTAVTPTYTYPDTGVYTAMLIAHSVLDSACDDTSYSTLKLAPSFNGNFTFTGGKCSKSLAFFDSSFTTKSNVNYWSWNFGDSTKSSAKDTVHTYTTPGTYTVKLISGTKDGCFDTTVKSISIYPVPKANFTANATGCTKNINFKDSSSISNDSITNRLWNFGDTSTSTVKNPTHLYNVSGTYNVSFVVTSSKGCKDSITKQVPAYSVPLVKTKSTGVSCNGNCDGTALVDVIGGTSPYTYLWSNGQKTVSVQQLCAKTYSVTVTDNRGCSSKDSIAITEPFPLKISSAKKDVLCFGFCDGKATATVTGGTMPYGYLWNDAALQTSSVATGLCSGKYKILISDSNKCVISDSVMIENLSYIITAKVIPEKSTIYNGQSINLYVEPSGYSYRWTPATGLSNNKIVNPQASPNNTITYFVTVTDSNGCTAGDSVTITVLCSDNEFYIPNAFTPNGDGRNDYFGVAQSGYTKMTMSIFSKWGEQMYESDSFDKTWNGKVGNVEAQQDVYVYVIYAWDCFGEKHKYIGHVTLLR